MTSLAQEDHRVVEIDSPSWCWSELMASGEGMLSFTSFGRRVRLAVPYAVDHEQIRIAMAPMNTTGWRAAGSDATLEIVGTDHDHRRWVVRATGRADRVASTAQDLALLASPLDRPRLTFDAPPSVLAMPRVFVRGFYEPGPLEDLAGAARGEHHP